MAYGDFKDSIIIRASDKILHDKAFNIAKNSVYDGYRRGLASMVYKSLIKRLRVVLLKIKICKTKNSLKNYTTQLLENLKKEKYTHLL